MQRLLRVVYPAQCTACDEPTDAEQGLCPNCWPDTQFVRGLCCDTCGVPLHGDDPTEIAQCDDCMQIERPWSRGRSAMVYDGVGRKLILRLKHGDRTDIVPALSKWLAQSLAPIMPENPLFVPVPLHWTRLVMRRYNQSALIAQRTAREVGGSCIPDALVRIKRTKSLDGRSKGARFRMLDGAIGVNAKHAASLKGRKVVLIDDVMTSGATLGACAEACLGAGAQQVCVGTLARVAKDT